MLSSALRLFKTTTTKKNESTSTNTQVLQRAKRKKSSPWRTLSPTTYLCRLKHTFWNRKYLRWFTTILFFFYFCQIWVGRISLLFVFESVCFSCLALTRCVHLNKEQQQVVLLWREKPVFFFVSFEQRFCSKFHRIFSPCFSLLQLFMFLLLLSFLLIQLLLSIPNRGTAIYLCVCVALLHHLSFAITHKEGFLLVRGLSGEQAASSSLSYISLLDGF